MSKTIVHTLNARGNIMLEMTRDEFQISPQNMQSQIQWMLDRTVAILASKGIRYSELKNALTPQQDRREIVLIFDTLNMTESWYGLPIYTRVLPLLDRRSSRRVLAGDYIGENHQQDVLYQLFAKKFVPIRDITFRYSNQFHMVYINNLTDAMVSSLQDGLVDFGPFAGFVDTTYASRFKWYLSTILPQLYIQHRTTIISGHEDDRPDVEDVNLPGLPFEEFGYILRSLPGYLQDVLLSYKIERPVIEGFEVDTEFSINAVNPNPIPIETFTIEIDERKFKYLASEKAESLRKIGLLGGDLTSLTAMI